MPVEVVVHVNTIVSPSVGLLTSAVNVGVAGLSEDQDKKYIITFQLSRDRKTYLNSNLKPLIHTSSGEHINYEKAYFSNAIE